MNKNKTLIVSNYNWDIEWIKITNDHGFSSKNTIIYDKSDGLKVNYDKTHADTLFFTEDSSKKDWSHLGKVIKSPNVGSGQYDLLEFIITNYNNLPDISVFIKGNILFTKDQKNYYTTLDRFIKTLNSNTFFSAWVDKCLLEGDERHLNGTPIEVLESGRLRQNVSECYDSRIEHRYFCHIHDILDWCFINPPKTNVIEFIPASNFSLPKENILKYSKNLYKKLQSIINYQPSYYTPWAKNVCGETYLLERIFYFIWNENLIEK